MDKVIYTPGHSREVDALILYGIVDTLNNLEERESLEDVKIYPRGSYFEIHTTRSYGLDFYKKLLELNRQDYSDFALFKTKKAGALLPILGFQNEEKFIRELWDTSNSITKRSVALDDLYSERPSLQGWRMTPCKKHIKLIGTELMILYMAAAPMLGKYLYNYDNGLKENVYHRLCGLCYLLASQGLLAGAYKLNLRAARGRQIRAARDRQIAYYIPTHETNADKIVSIQKAVKAKENILKVFEDFPTISLPIALLYDKDPTFLYVLESMGAILYSYRLIYTGQKIGVWAVRSVSDHPLQNYINFFKRMREESDTIRDIDKIFPLIKDSDFSYVFSTLSLAVLNNNPEIFYSFLRDYTSLATRQNKALFSQSFVEKAFEYFLS
ncbi:MAG: hypothetical protein QXL52_04820 [Nitrososphaerales archaeon]